LPREARREVWWTEVAACKECKDGSIALGFKEGSKVNKQVLITGNREIERGEGE
jgi:hypothetical protein